MEVPLERHLAVARRVQFLRISMAGVHRVRDQPRRQRIADAARLLPAQAPRHLVHAALIAYPLYVTPEGWPCEAEDLVDRLIAARDQPTPKAPRGQVQRWAAGIIASLDRKPPPSY